MKSPKIQSFWTGFVFVMLLLFGGAGYFFFTSFSSYGNSKSNFERLKGERRKLEGAKIYPSEEHVKKYSDKLDEYVKEVDGLHGQLKTFQKPLNAVSPVQFPQDLKKKIEAFRTYTEVKKVTKPEDFYFGMEEYATSTPVPGATGILSYQLEAVENLLHVAIENEADVVYGLKRERTAVEASQPDPELTERVAKYPVNFSFRTTTDGFQAFLNQVSNDPTYFYIVRVVRVDSEIGKSTGTAKLGPLIGGSAQPVSFGVLPAEGAATDAVQILGNEKLRVTAVIDLCRFPDIAK